MPCLNEAETLATCIQKAHTGAKQANVEEYEILIADNGSTDGSQQIAESNGARVIHVADRGYGAALLGGIAQAQGQFIIMADADDSYDWSELKDFVVALRAGNQLVMGSRLRGKILPGAMPFLHRWLGNPVLTAIGNLFFGAGVSDFHCGLRGFDAQAIRSLNLHTTGMEFATEMVAKASLAGFTTSEIPITYYPDGRTRQPHLRTWRDGWRHLSFMMILSPNWVLLYPSIVFAVVGFLLLFLTLPAPLVINETTFDVHTLSIATLSVIVSCQLFVFWLISRVTASSMFLMPTNKIVQIVESGRYFNLFLLVGIGLAVIGILPILSAFSVWVQQSFGALDYQITLRWLLLGILLIVVGLQIFFASFVLALMSFRKTT